MIWKDIFTVVFNRAQNAGRFNFTLEAGQYFPDVCQKILHFFYPLVNKDTGYKFPLLKAS